MKTHTYSKSHFSALQKMLRNDPAGVFGNIPKKKKKKTKRTTSEKHSALTGWDNDEDDDDNQTRG